MEINTKTAIGEFLESLEKLAYNTSDDWGPFTRFTSPRDARA